MWPVIAATGAPSYFVSLLQSYNIRHAGGRQGTPKEYNSDMVVIHALSLELLERFCFDEDR